MQIKSIIGLLISLILLIALAYSVRWKDVWLVLQDMKFWPLLPAFILFLSQFYLRSLRWKLLLPVQGELNTKNLFDSIMVGNLANFLLPMRAGEFIRPYLLNSFEPKISFATGLVSVVIERFFDLTCVLALFAAVTLINHNLPVEVSYGAYALSLLAAGIFTFTLMGSFLEKPLSKIIDKLTCYLPDKIASTTNSFFKNFLHGTSIVVRSPKRSLLIMFASMLVWLLTILLNMVFFWLFDISPSFETVIGTTVITALAVAAPSAPGFLGVYQWACLAAFSLYSLPTDKAAAYSIITHLFNYIFFIGFGGWVIWNKGIKLLEISKKASSMN